MEQSSWIQSKLSRRLDGLPLYATAHLEMLKTRAIARGLDIVDLGIGSPDRQTPQPVLDAMVEALHNPTNHRYPNFRGLLPLRQAFADWYERRFGVLLDPEREVLPLIGSKEGIAHFPLAFIDPGDKVIMPSPCYPVHRSGTVLAGGELVQVPLKAENAFLANWEEIPTAVADQAKIMIFNYPNNPTAAVADHAYFEKTLAFAERHDLILMHDMAYSEINFDGFEPTSLLTLPGAKRRSVEFFSLSKSYNMGGWRVGFAAGSAELIEALFRIKSHVDYGIFPAVQHAAVAALNLPETHSLELSKLYQERRDAVIETLASIGCHAPAPKATIFVWAPVAEGMTSSEFIAHVIEETGVMLTPGTGFGAEGEGYFRLSLVAEAPRLQEAITRLGRLGFSFPRLPNAVKV